MGKLQVFQIDTKVSTGLVRIGHLKLSLFVVYLANYLNKTHSNKMIFTHEMCEKCIS